MRKLEYVAIGAILVVSIALFIWMLPPWLTGL